MTENQSIYKDEQNNVIDIEKIYDNYIKEIDNIRSYANLGAANSTVLKTLKRATLLGIAKLIKMESTPQESRCHAFFRLIGFPVVDKDYRFYNPGHDIIFDEDREITLDYKIDVANNPLDTFVKASNDREVYPQLFHKIFSQVGGITPSVLALTSAKSREFGVPIKDGSDPFVTTDEEQKYAANLFGYVGKNKHPLSSFPDQNGTVAYNEGLVSTRFHYIRPFLIDPRIDFTIYPVRKRIAIPFVHNKTQLKVSEHTYVQRPLIEKIIRDRLTVEDSEASLGTSNETLKDYILSVSSIKDEPLIKQMTGNDVFGTEATSQFVKYLHIIRAMCRELVNAQLTIRRIQSKYYWLPIPSENGPESGVSVRNVLISKEIDKSFTTKSDLQLIRASLRKFGQNFNSELKGSDDRPDNGNFALGEFETTFDSEDSEALGDLISDSVEQLTNLRTKDMQDANNALRKIEVIMGEFSGFGLCDILAILGALHIMPEDDLVGFLDTDAFKRMKLTLNKEAEDVESSDITSAMQAFSAKVTDLYNLMDKIYSDIALKNQLI